MGEYGGLSTGGGARAESPGADDDNDEVSQVAQTHPPSCFHTPFPQHINFTHHKVGYSSIMDSSSPLPHLSNESEKHNAAAPIQSLTPSTQESDNNDFCSACGSSGYLLCCDGCDKSFHFKCLDPPISEDAHELNEPWYCVSCVARQPTAGQPERARRGLFGPLFKNLDKRNPSNFQLPLEVRDHFVGVSTGKFGEFVEAVNAKTR